VIIQGKLLWKVSFKGNHFETFSERGYILLSSSYYEKKNDFKNNSYNCTPGTTLNPLKQLMKYEASKNTGML